MRAAGRWSLAERLTCRANRIDARLAALEAEWYRLNEGGELRSRFQRKSRGC